MRINMKSNFFRHYLRLALILCLVPAALSLPVQQSAQTQAPAAGSASSDPGWPRAVQQDGARLVYYQPQIGEWKDYRLLTGDVAVSLTPPGGKPILGVASLKASTMADLEKRSVVVRDIEITSSRFPTADKEISNALDQLLRKLFPTPVLTISLDRILAGLQRSEASAKPVKV